MYLARLSRTGDALENINRVEGKVVFIYSSGQWRDILSEAIPLLLFVYFVLTPFHVLMYSCSKRKARHIFRILIR